MELLDVLNLMQTEAVIDIENPLLILAGAGSGKTRVITYKIAYLIKNGFKPESILALTFTNKAANEMKERAIALSSDAERVWISTFHSMCVRILRIEADRLGYKKNFTILDAKDSLALIKTCLKELNIDDKIFVPKNVQAQISFNKNKLISPNDFCNQNQNQNNFRASKISDIYNLYQEKLKRENLLDFDDLISLTVELFKTYPDVLEKYKQKFRYILVDEYQDTNAAQYKLIKLLAEKNICVVGDDDQSIYSWRGANIKNILDFEKDFCNARTIKLEQNYRSTQIILDAANSVIKNNSMRKIKNLWTCQKGGNKIFIYHAENYIDEAKFLSHTILNNIQEYEYKDCAVLYRNNFQSRVIEEEFVKKDIPYRLVGSTRFYERMEIKDLLAYLKFINNPDDDISFMRVVSTPKKGIGSKTLEKIDDFAFENKISRWQVINNKDFLDDNKSKNLKSFIEQIDKFISYKDSNSISDLFENIISEINYYDYLKKYDGDYDSRLENIQEFLAKITEFESINKDISLTDFLEQISLLSDTDDKNNTGNCISLMTLHGAKGLEFPCVFIFGADDELFPGRFRTDFEIEEERRLFYVGITRAKQNLYISSSEFLVRNGETIKSEPSRFISEIPENLTENIRQQKFIKTSFENKKIISNSNRNLFKPREYTVKNNFKINQEMNFSAGDKVKHFKFGICLVKKIENTEDGCCVTIELSDGSKKILLAELAKFVPVE